MKITVGRIMKFDREVRVLKSFFDNTRSVGEDRYVLEIDRDKRNDFWAALQEMESMAKLLTTVDVNIKG